jgi:hypothetical protein
VAPGAAGARRGGNRDIRHPSIGGFCLRAQAAVASTLGARPQAATPTTRRHPMPRDTSQWRFETQSVHAGYEPDPTTNAVAVPIYQTVAYASTAPSTAPTCST